MDGYYIAPVFMDNLLVHISKNFMNLPNIKVRDTLHLVKNFQYIFLKSWKNPLLITIFSYFNRFLLFLVFGVEKVKESPFSVSLYLQSWESSEKYFPFFAFGANFIPIM